MRILLIHQFYLEKNDGGGSRWNEMTRIWAESGHEITVLAGMVHYASGKKNERYKGQFTSKEVFAPGITVVRSYVSEAYNVSFIGRLWAYFSFVISSIYAGIFRTGTQFDIILVTSPPLFVGVTAWVLSKVKNIPFVFEVRDLWPESAIDTGVLTNPLIIKVAYWVEGFLYRSAKAVNVLTPAFREKLINVKGVPADKLIYIPNAADFSLSDHLAEQFDVGAFREEHDLVGRFVITYVGAHGVANHLIQVVEAATLLQPTDPDVLFLLIGEGMEKAALKEVVRQRGLTNIRFIDAVPKTEVFRYILASDMGTSVLKKNDTFKTVYSNKTFDYMSCKKPVLLLIDGVSRALVEAAGCGQYVEPENPALLAEAVCNCKSNPVLLKQQGASGYAYAKHHFDRQVLANQYLDRLVAVAAGWPPPQ